MPGLVTLGSAPYNPYNTDFASFALKGLDMAQRDMAQTDARNQQGIENVMRFGEQISSAIRTNAELKLKWADQQRLKEAQAAQSQMEAARIDLAKDAQSFDEQKWADLAPNRALDIKQAEAGIEQTKAATELNRANLRRVEIATTTDEVMAPFRVEREIAGFATKDAADALSLYTAAVGAEVSQSREKRLTEAGSYRGGRPKTMVDAFKNTPSAILASGLDGAMKSLQQSAEVAKSLISAEASRVEKDELGTPATVKASLLDEKKLKSLSESMTGLAAASALAAELKAAYSESSAYEAAGQDVPTDLSAKIARLRKAHEDALKHTQEGFKSVAPGIDASAALVPPVRDGERPTAVGVGRVGAELQGAAAAVNDILK